MGAGHITIVVKRTGFRSAAFVAECHKPCTAATCLLPRSLYVMKKLVLIFLTAISLNTWANEMKEIEYFQHEPHYESEQMKGDLVSFVYDVPYLAACGIFPPLHILNQVLSKGGGDAGMSPGASWEPFSLSDHEYDELWKAIENTDPSTLNARFTFVKYKRDPELETITKHMKWVRKACEKHREWFFEEQNKQNDV